MGKNIFNSLHRYQRVTSYSLDNLPKSFLGYFASNQKQPMNPSLKTWICQEYFKCTLHPERQYLCNKRRFGSGNVSTIAERIAFTRASFLSISFLKFRETKYS